MNVSRTLRIVLLVALTSVGSVYAGGPFILTVDRASRIVSATGYTTFSVYVRNVSGENVPLRVIRVVNERPDTAWHISICSPEHCYGEEVDSLEVQNLSPGMVGGASVHVTAGASDSARVVLQIDSGPGGYQESLELNVAVGEPPQPPIAVSPGSLISYGNPEDSVEFFVVVTNTTPVLLSVRARRIESNFPSGGVWRSVLCTLYDCFDDSVGTTPEVEVAPGGATAFRLRMFTGALPLSQGQVEVAFDPGDAGDPVYFRFLVTVSSASGIAESARGEALDSPYPIPADRFVTIPLPGDLSPENASISLYDMAGHPIAGPTRFITYIGSDEGAAVRLDVGDLSAGVYYYRLTSDSRTESGRFVIKH